MTLALLLGRPEAQRWLEACAEEEGLEPQEGEEEMTEPRGPDRAQPEAPRVMVLDIETRRGAEEVGGWCNCHLMGLALAVVWDSRTEQFTTYFERQASELLRELAKADLVVGFNLIGFDYKVLSAYDDGTLARLPTFDILQDVRRRLGYRLSLAHLAEKTLGVSKSADGLQSLEWVRQGRLDLVEEYCRQDVRVTAELFRHGLSKGRLRFTDKEGRLLELTVDWDLETLAGKK
jgi:DEAD/DEAH box helicase domain-containing protein